MMKKYILFSVLFLLPMVALADASGSCGSNVTYSFIEATHTLTISGTGDIRDCSYDGSSQPWASYRDQIYYVIIEPGVTAIGLGAFANCKAVKSVQIPGTVVNIGNYAFCDCSGLTSLTLPEGVTSIEGEVFRGCSGLKSVTIPSSVAGIGMQAFAGCSSLTAVRISDLSAWCRIAFGGYTSNPLSSAHHLYLNGREVTKLVVPDDVTKIGDCAFYGCSGLTSATFPDGLVDIGAYAFYGCNNLTTVTIPSSVSLIGGEAFDMCQNLKSVHISDLSAWCRITFYDYPSNPLCYAHHLYLNNQEVTNLVIPEDVISLGNYAFYGCSGLTSVTLHNNVANMGVQVFYNCTGLTSVKLSETLTDISDDAFYGCKGLTSIVIPSSVSIIGNGAFHYCSGLTSVTIPNSVKSIGNEAFRYCTGFTSFTIPDGVERIGWYTFYGCSGLTSLTIGSGVQTIGNSAFAYCLNMEDVYCYAYQVPTTSTNAFDFTPIASANLHVPNSSLNAYGKVVPWKNFGNIIGMYSLKCAKPTITYDHDNKKLTFSCETEGVEYVYDIKDSDIMTGSSSEVQLSAIYEISVYAAKLDHENSDVATATLVWGASTFSDASGTTSSRPLSCDAPLLIKSHDGMLSVEGAADGTQVSVYGINGTEAGSAVSRNGLATVSTRLQPGSVAVIKIADRVVKVAIK